MTINRSSVSKSNYIIIIILQKQYSYTFSNDSESL